ncbi:MAG: TetR/AcrR family transcriptional regulator [Rikenellaceae bacterium]
MRKNTKEIYADSLLDLLRRSSYDVITISEICDNTPLTRRTFYNNFSSKEDVVIFICNNLMDRYIDMLRSEERVTLATIATRFCQFGASNKELFMLIIDNDIYHIFVRVGIKRIVDVGSFVPNSIVDEPSETQRKYINLFHAVGTLNLFEQWLIGGMKESPEEMSSIYTSIVRETHGL